MIANMSGDITYTDKLSQIIRCCREQMPYDHGTQHTLQHNAQCQSYYSKIFWQTTKARLHITSNIGIISLKMSTAEERQWQAPNVLDRSVLEML